MKTTWKETLLKKNNRILTFYGEGKGKTTAALGIALRASGHRKKSLVFHFIKSKIDVGEMMTDNPNIISFMVGEGFVKKKTNNDIHQCAVKSGLGFLAGINSPEFDVIILDEIIWAVYLNLISEEELFNFLTECIWKNQTVILTGRPLVKNIIDISDVVTEMKCEKHDFNSGTKAQLGIEF